MRNLIKCTAAVISVLLLSSCQIQDFNTESDTDSGEKEYTVVFSSNCPLDNGTLSYSVSGTLPSSLKVKEGEEVVLPSFSGVLTEFKNGEESSCYVFEKWNTDSKGNGESCFAGASCKVTKDMTFYAVYSALNQNEETDTAVDFSITTSYSMKTGESVVLASAVEGETVWYVIQSGDDVVEIADGKLNAVGPGSAVVTASDFDESKTWSCAFTVTAEGTCGFSLDFELIGRWEDGESYVVFNADKTGELKVYRNNSVLQESTFEWSSFENSYGKYITLTNCSAGYLEGKQYTITEITASTMKLHGYLAFGAEKDTVWTRL